MSSPNSAYSILLGSILASDLETLERQLAVLLHEDIARVDELVFRFLSQPISPAAFLHFEKELQEIVREVGRKVMEFTSNECEPESHQDAPHDVTYQGGGYRRMKDKTPNRYVDTTFGRITLWRRGYRYWHRGDKESTIFPVELILGLAGVYKLLRFVS